MKKVLFLIPVVVLILFGCIHGRFKGSDGRSMYYAFPLDEVFVAAQTVLKEQEFRVIEINPPDKLIKAVKDTSFPGAVITVVLTFREEGTGTWMEVAKKVPPQFSPGSTANLRMDVDDLFRFVGIELERSH